MGSVRALILIIALSCKQFFNSLADLKESELNRIDSQDTRRDDVSKTQPSLPPSLPLSCPTLTQAPADNDISACVRSTVIYSLLLLFLVLSSPELRHSIGHGTQIHGSPCLYDNTTLFFGHLSIVEFLSSAKHLLVKIFKHDRPLKVLKKEEQIQDRFGREAKLNEQIF